MKRIPADISDGVIRERREVTVTGRIRGDWKNADGTHSIVIDVPADVFVEIGGKP